MPDRRDAAAGEDDGTGKSPDAYRTISEVSERLGVPQHVLRFWETRFIQIKPLKRAGGRRHYRPEDIALLARIRELLHDEGYSIKGVQRLLKAGGARKLIDGGASQPEKPTHGEAPPPGPQPEPPLDRDLKGILAELESMRDLLR